MQCSTKTCAQQRTTAHNSAQQRCFENGNDDFGVEAFWIGDAARVGYFVPLNGPLNGHPPSLTRFNEIDLTRLPSKEHLSWQQTRELLPYRESAIISVTCPYSKCRSNPHLRDIKFCQLFS